MNDSPPGGSSTDSKTRQDRLDSWKEIAAYLQRDVTTVQRWEKREAMPVRRHVHDKLGSVYAFRSELDAWTRDRNPSASESGASVPPDVPTSASRSMLAWPLIAAGLLAAALAVWWLSTRTAYVWRNPLDDARFEKLTDFGGSAQAAAISRDGRLVAFASDREGPMDVWVTQVGTGVFHNRTQGRVTGLGNPVVRTLGFSPDGALVTFWVKGTVEGADASKISVWAIPTLGGQPTMYLEGVAEFDWSADGSRLVYHIPADGDPTFVRTGAQSATAARQVYVAPDKLHAHFPLWSPKGDFVYFVQGAMQNNVLIDNADIWRVKPDGTSPERITSQRGYMTHPVLLDERTLAYLAKDPDGSGPAIYSMDVERREPHRVSSGLDRYTSLSASADGHHLVATLSNPTTTLWRMRVADTPLRESAATPIALTTGAGFAPRLGPGYLLYVSSTAASDGIWKITHDASVELWSAPDARVIGGPEISPDGHAIAVSVAQLGKTLLYVMNADGTQAHVVTDALELRGAPAWATDGAIVSAADVGGTPHLFRIAPDGTHAALVSDYALDPVSSPAGDFLVYSGADVGTEFVVKAATTQGDPYSLMDLKLTRGARRLRFFNGQRTLLVMEGDIQHKNLWLIDLVTGKKRQLTNLEPDFTIRDFNISPDGRDIVLERVQDRSDIVLIDLAHRG